MKKKVYIRVGQELKTIGEIEEGIFTSYRKTSQHLYRKLNAWGIDYKALKGMVENEKVHTIRIVDTETNTEYKVNATTFFEKGTVLHFKPHRTQVFLPLEFWE